MIIYLNIFAYNHLYLLIIQLCSYKFMFIYLYLYVFSYILFSFLFIYLRLFLFIFLSLLYIHIILSRQHKNEYRRSIDDYQPAAPVRRKIGLYWILATLRIALTFAPQTGYIHPDEFFQSIEVISGMSLFFELRIPFQHSFSLRCFRFTSNRRPLRYRCL